MARTRLRHGQTGMKQERAFPWKGTLCGVGAAVLFGLSAPLAKRLLPDSSPLLLAALFYLGAAAGLSAAMRWRAPDEPDREARLRFSDAPALIAIIVLGGIIGPVLMLYGLGRVSGVSGALLLNLEAPFTVALAALVFG